MKFVCFFAACRNRNSYHSFGHVLFDHHPGDNPVPLLTGILEDV